MSNLKPSYPIIFLKCLRCLSYPGKSFPNSKGLRRLGKRRDKRVEVIKKGMEQRKSEGDEDPDSIL